MVEFPLLLRRAAPAAFGLTVSLLAAFPAAAQPCADPACQAALPAGNACRVYVSAPIGIQRVDRAALDRGAAAGVELPIGCYQPGHVYGLQGWRFNMRGGHKVKGIRLLQDGTNIDFAFFDHDAHDFADGFAWLVPLPAGAVQRTATRTCRGPCDLALERKASDEIFVLVGFEFLRSSNDGHLRALSIGPSPLTTPTQEFVRVNFRDDDFEYRVTLQYSYVQVFQVTGVAPPGFAARLLDPAVVGKSYRRYEPGFGEAVIRGTRPHPDLSDAVPPGDTVLAGFSFSFSNGGHFLEDLGLERTPSTYEAWFQDHQDRSDRREPDDPFVWSASFIMLR